jgi:tetratricopeptide (TPR) repeat protein
MAEVYLADQQSLGRQVALKVLKKELASDSTCVQRFRREAQAAASLVHANIVQVHEVACIDGVHFIAQEYVQGVNLQQYLARNGNLDLKLALLVIRQAAAALAKAADQKIVHRDIKPENIMITKSGEVKVADFGLARVLQLEGSVQLTQAGMTMGTPLYMSPEQAEGKPLDHRSDIYSLGIACYHVLAGKPPFKGDTALAVAVQHLNKPPEPLENLRPDLPPALARIIHKMIAKSPDHRHQSARELIRELRPLLQEHLDEELGDDLPGLDTASLDMVNTSLHAATQRLDAVMHAGAETRSYRFRVILYAAAVLAAFAFGGWIARATVMERPLLEDAKNASVYGQKKDTLSDQVEQALYVDSLEPPNIRDAEQAWRSVVKYWSGSGDIYSLGPAYGRLGEIYLDQQEFRKALDAYQELYNLAGDPEKQWKAEALAGQYQAYDLMGEFQQRDRIGAELLPLRDQLRGGPFEYTVLEKLQTQVEKQRGSESTRKTPPSTEGT